jgi:hypothetical protein
VRRFSSAFARFELWAGNVLKLRKRNSVKLVAAIAAVLILVGGVFKAAEEIFRFLGKAPVDAGEVAKIRKEVEQQRDTIAAVARDANTAHDDAKNAAELSEQAKTTLQTATKTAAEARDLVATANAEADRLRQTSTFALLLSKAQADDRKALEELIQIAQAEKHPFHDEAFKALQRIVADLQSRSVESFDWKRFGVDRPNASFTDLRDMFDIRPVFDRPAILIDIAREQRFGKFETFSFVYDVLKSTGSIVVLNAACNAMREEAKLNYNILGYDKYIQWWDDHAAEYAGVNKYKPNENLARTENWPNVSPTPELPPSP